MTGESSNTLVTPVLLNLYVKHLKRQFLRICASGYSFQAASHTRTSKPWSRKSTHLMGSVRCIVAN